VSGVCINTLTGHTKAVTSVAMSWDDLKLISASWDKSVKIWDFDTGECLNTLTGHSDWVRSVAISRDSSTIVSGSQDNTIKVWNVKNGNCINTLTGHRFSVLSIAITSDGSKIISGSYDKSVKVWSLDTGQCLHTFKGHTEAVRSVAISNDQTNIFSASEDKNIKVWDIQTGNCITTLQGHTGIVSSLANCSTKIEKSIFYLLENEKRNEQAIAHAAARISALKQNTIRVDTEQSAFESKINSLEEQHNATKQKFTNEILDLQGSLQTALDEMKEMKSKQTEHEKSFNIILNSTRTELKKDILDAKTELNNKMKSLEAQHDKVKKAFTKDISNLQYSLKTALDERRNMESKLRAHRKAINNDHETILSLDATLNNTTNELKKEILDTKTQQNDKMTLLKVQQDNAKETFTKDILSLQDSLKTALEERKVMECKLGEHKNAMDKADEIISNLNKTLKNMMLERANKKVQKQLVQEQARKDAHEKSSKAWNKVASQAKENASRTMPANIQGYLMRAMETTQNGKCKHLLEKACALFSNLEKLQKNQFVAMLPSEYEKLETNTSSNAQYIQMLDTSYNQYIKDIKEPSDIEYINQRNHTSQEVMTALKNHKIDLENKINVFDAKISHVDDLAFENARDTLKVDSLLLLSELMDDYFPSILKWNAIDKELAAWKSKELTWNNIFSIAPDEFEMMYAKVKEHQLLPKTIEKSEDSLESNMKRVETWMEDYVTYLKRKKFENDLLYVQHQIKWIKSIHKLDERTQYHLVPDADIKRMNSDEMTLSIVIEYSKDKNVKQELQRRQKKILDSLKAMQWENKTFIEEVKLVPHQIQVNFPERCVVNDLLGSKMEYTKLGKNRATMYGKLF